MTAEIPELYFLELRFRALAPIRGLPHFHGPQWAGLMKSILRLGSAEAGEAAAAGVSVQPVETGVLDFEPGTPVHLGLSFPRQRARAVFEVLGRFDGLAAPGGHFTPGKTLALEQVVCRVGGGAYSPQEDLMACCRPLAEEALRPEMDALAGLDRFSLCWYTPLRLTRPAGAKSKGHRYADEAFFFGPGPEDAPDPMDHLVCGIRFGPSFSSRSAGLRLCGGALNWLDAAYGREVRKTIGGGVGRLEVLGRPEPDTARRLVIGQYIGAGKNGQLGFGFYRIPQLDSARRILPLSRGRPLLARAAAPLKLEEALKRLPDSSPGPDGLGIEDILKAGPEYLERLSHAVAGGEWRPSAAKIYRVPKKDSSFRELAVQNVSDRMVFRALADFLQPIVERLLSDSAYAYRRGLSAKGAAKALRKALAAGWDTGIKADIDSFFGSIRIPDLVSLLEGLFGNDTLAAAIESWLGVTLGQGIGGLAQGNPLSPVLSNLFLDRFDRNMEREGFRLIRYADDFVVLFPPGTGTEEGLGKVEKCLERLGLRLNCDKTVSVTPGAAVRFLGYLVSASEVAEDASCRSPEDDSWLPLFREQCLKGAPVYLTSVCRGAYSSGAFLMVNGEGEAVEKIPWSRVGRLVVVGRSSFSGGVVYRAVKEEVPVTFIDVLGRFSGQLSQSPFEAAALEPVQRECLADQVFGLDFARRVIAAKINNSRVMLRRKNIDPPELKDLEEKAAQADDLDQLRGYEGAASRVYFAGFAKLVKPFEFKGRIYHPPDGPVNGMLSFGYTLLYNRLAAVLRDKGFNSRLGFFHQARGRHCALASDLMEELRHVVERVVLALIRMREVKNEDFETATRGDARTCRLAGEGFRKFIRRFEQTMARETSYHGGEKMSYNAYLDEMADGLRRSMKLKVPYKPLRIN